MTPVGDSAHPQVGVGWRFPISWNRDGAVALSGHDEHERVRQAMELVLRTAIGERTMRPEFGAGIDRFVFAPRTEQVVFQLTFAVEQALLRWEPRIYVDSVSGEAVGDARIDVSITYRLDPHRRPSNLVMPFYLDDQAVARGAA